jgi:hypothetical protein
MDVFSLRDRLVGEFRSYVRSFIHIADDQIRELVDSALDRGLLWPEPLIQLDPCFESGSTIDELVDEGVLHDECRRCFRIKRERNDPGRPLRLHRHQAEAVRVARTGANWRVGRRRPPAVSDQPRSVKSSGGFSTLGPAGRDR